ncbi:MAG: twin-arginine translocation signal domain-containing protein [Rhodocyclaceae bacterium]|nr:twin-arginine translocation signal domain-containing protein [Rhodocyclaceae bacterium]
MDSRFRGNDGPMITRRQFIKAGVIGGAALAAAGLFYSRGLKEAPVAAVSPGLTFENRPVIAAIVPAILAGALPESGEARKKAIAQTVDGVGIAIAGLSASAQKELEELFTLLGIAPMRMLLAGVWPRWEEASPAQIAAFLQGWRTSRLELLRSAYAALHDLVLGAWYGTPDNWEAIGYPGPPEML